MKYREYMDIVQRATIKNERARIAATLTDSDRELIRETLERDPHVLLARLDALQAEWEAKRRR